MKEFYLKLQQETYIFWGCLFLKKVSFQPESSREYCLLSFQHWQICIFLQSLSGHFWLVSTYVYVISLYNALFLFLFFLFNMSVIIKDKLNNEAAA